MEKVYLVRLVHLVFQIGSVTISFCEMNIIFLSWKLYENCKSVNTSSNGSKYQIGKAVAWQVQRVSNLS